VGTVESRSGAVLASAASSSRAESRGSPAIYAGGLPMAAIISAAKLDPP
jgi:hypothetical protein